MFLCKLICDRFCELELELQPGNAQFRSKLSFFMTGTLWKRCEIWTDDTHIIVWSQLKLEVVWSYITQNYSCKTFEILQVLFSINLSIVYHRSSLSSILLSSWRCHLVSIRSNHPLCCSNRHQLPPVPLTAVWMVCHHVRRAAANCTKPPGYYCPIMTMKSLR